MGRCALSRRGGHKFNELGLEVGEMSICRGWRGSNVYGSELY